LIKTDNGICIEGIVNVLIYVLPETKIIKTDDKKAKSDIVPPIRPSVTVILIPDSASQSSNQTSDQIAKLLQRLAYNLEGEM